MHHKTDIQSLRSNNIACFLKFSFRTGKQYNSQFAALLADVKKRQMTKKPPPQQDVSQNSLCNKKSPASRQNLTIYPSNYSSELNVGSTYFNDNTEDVFTTSSKSKIAPLGDFQQTLSISSCSQSKLRINRHLSKSPVTMGTTHSSEDAVTVSSETPLKCENAVFSSDDELDLLFGKRNRSQTDQRKCTSNGMKPIESTIKRKFQADNIDLFTGYEDNLLVAEEISIKEEELLENKSHVFIESDVPGPTESKVDDQSVKQENYIVAREGTSHTIEETNSDDDTLVFDDSEEMLNNCIVSTKTDVKKEFASFNCTNIFSGISSVPNAPLDQTGTGTGSSKRLGVDEPDMFGEDGDSDSDCSVNLMADYESQPREEPLESQLRE